MLELSVHETVYAANIHQTSVSNEMTQKTALSPVQIKALGLLLKGENISQVADLVKVNRETIYRWFDNKDFASAYEQGKSQIFTKMLADLEGLGELATDTLRKIMLDDEASPAARGRVALGTLDLAVRIHKITEVEREVEALRQQLEEIKEERREYGRLSA